MCGRSLGIIVVVKTAGWGFWAGSPSLREKDSSLRSRRGPHRLGRRALRPEINFDFEGLLP